MPLEPYQQYRPTTPKSTTPSPKLPGSAHSRNPSGASTWSSPDSVATHATTPNASPLKHSGPTNILPRIRTQDQGLEPDIHASSSRRRAQSHEVDERSTASDHRPSYQRSTTSPPEFPVEATPISAASTLDPWVDSAGQSPITFSTYAHPRFGHSRSISASSIEPAAFRRVGNPHYLSQPVYIPAPSPQYVPAMIPAFEDMISLPLVAPTRGLTPELVFNEGDDYNSTKNIATYLTEPNPYVIPVPDGKRGYGDGNPKHFWWDIRNLRNWDDFNHSTITNIPDFDKLLNFDVKAAALPSQPPLQYSSLNPQDLKTLATTIQNFHIAKVNDAIKVAQPAHHHITMTRRDTKEDGAYFLSAYGNDHDATLAGNGRGRVVGLVKPYEVWNTGKRNEAGQARVLYLRHLAHLQVLMRANNCRYGFIITEIELVCVRMGTLPGTPNFGLLELSKPIAMSTSSGSFKEEDGGMTACLALWYLNMLAGDTPLQGQCGWKIDVGPPEAQSRAQVLKEGNEGRDEWMPKFNTQEIRSAKTLRGWAWPEDPVHRSKEGVNTGRGGRRR